MKNKKVNNNSNGKKEDDKLKKKNNLVNPNENASISNLWQRYSPMAWSETYNEYINYTRRMTEIYNEYAKSFTEDDTAVQGTGCKCREDD